MESLQKMGLNFERGGICFEKKKLIITITTVSDCHSELSYPKR